MSREIEQTPVRTFLEFQEPPYDFNIGRHNGGPTRAASMTTLKNHPVPIASKSCQTEELWDDIERQIKTLKERLRSEGVAIEELTDQVGMLESQNYQLRQQNQQFSDKLNQSASQCETCIDYIKEVRRLEIGMQKALDRER